ncbi:MAG TPA: penicillin-binding protein 1C [Ideonella sp.]|uniref:penicillin-binding protein 1C n=1 Tax=Ideonella sp. TaxID=1929293 RepID=UPI002E3608CB|nr:penicillin-binding protein 1C [Ideonella sp.]HEX5682968.1 penicillin-binding protein 1C [Ideonella sp.]
MRRLVAPMLLMMVGAAWAGELPRFGEVKAAWRPSDQVLLDRHGEPLQTVRTNLKVRKLDWVPLTEISPAMRTALLLSEDKRFYEHSGVDWSAVGAAAFGNLWNSRTRGASTLTMQLAGLLDPKASGRGGNRSLGTKLTQAGTALALEKRWRKDQILEAYLNLVPYRGEQVGIAAMAATLFSKRPSGLDAQEAAIAVALLRAPNASPATVSQRACVILREQKLDCVGLEGATVYALGHTAVARLDGDTQLAPHVARRLLRGEAAPQVRSTLDAGLQRFARDTLRRQLAELRGRQVDDGALLVIDNTSGDVLAWVGSSGPELSQAGEVDGVLARRQAGSTLKPFLYGLAIEQRWLTAASLIDDSPLGLETVGGLYIPQNYDKRFKGLVSVRTALAGSLNVPAVRTLVSVTPEAFFQRLNALGLGLRESGGYYGHSLALGSAEVALADLANAYRALANGGRVSALRFKPGDAKAAPRAVLDPAAAFIVTDMLADREARAVTFGLDNVLATRRWSAVKTGTSKDMRDNWCVGFSRRHTVAVWIGNASGLPMADVSGVSGAAPIWRAVMDELWRRDAGATATTKDPAPPAGLVRQALRFDPAIEPPRHEWFLAGTEQATIVRADQAPPSALIAQPIARTVLALDPDIPPAAQKMRIAPAHAMPNGWRWRLDGRVLGAAQPMQWLPWPGSHRLELLDAKGAVREAVVFEVRGALVKGPRVAQGEPKGRSLH